MAPKDFIAARQNKTDDPVIVDHQPYYPHLVVDPTDEDSIRKVVATRFSANGQSQSWPVTAVAGGITNQLFRVDRHDGPSILVRIFGAEGMIDRDAETSTFAAIAEKGLGPKYYGRFANGRMEGWFDGMVPLTARGMADPTISRSIAQKLAQLHSNFIVPEDLSEFHNTSKPNMWTQLMDWMDQAHKAKFQNDNDTERAKSLNLDNLPAELEWLRQEVVPKDAPVSMCHNDLLAANILHSPSTTGIQLIDFEYGGINYKAFDIANHFNEYAGGTEDGNTNYDWFPTKKHQIMFLEAYVESAKSEISASEWYDQVQSFVMANHLYWGLWAVNQAATEGCKNFDYLLFAKNRIGQYWVCKEKSSSST
jgi:ethanolamine kinase